MKAEPLTAAELALFREGLRFMPTMTNYPDPHIPLPGRSLLDITTAEWADRCRRLLATLDVAEGLDVERLMDAIFRTGRDPLGMLTLDEWGDIAREYAALADPPEPDWTMPDEAPVPQPPRVYRLSGDDPDGDHHVYPAGVGK